jgi:hypothetical protein
MTTTTLTHKQTTGTQTHTIMPLHPTHSIITYVVLVTNKALQLGSGGLQSSTLHCEGIV